MINVASMCGRLSQVSQQFQNQLQHASSVDDVTDVMNKFVSAAQEGKQKEAGFSNSAYGMSKLGIIAAGRVHAEQLREKEVRLGKLRGKEIIWRLLLFLKIGFVSTLIDNINC